MSSLHSKSVEDQLLIRRCVSCGYDGRLLVQREPRRCPRCGVDLKRRPAKSYAEMEGFLEPRARQAPGLRVGRGRERSDRQSRVIQRWLAFLFVVGVGMVFMAYLVGQAMP